MPHVLLKCDDPGSRRAAASTRFDVPLFRALMGEDSAAVSRHSHSVQDGYLRRQLASPFMYQRLCVCDALVCVQMFAVGSLWDEKLSPNLVYLRDVRAGRAAAN